MMSQAADWLVMIYAGACNDLQPEFQAFIRRVGTRFPPAAGVLLQITSAEPAQPQWAGNAHAVQTMRYTTAPDTHVLIPVPGWNPFPRPAHNPGHLYDFIKWGLSLPGFRHARPVLVLSGHSAGLLGVLEDRSQGYPMLMPVSAMARALRAAQQAVQRRMELLVLDMCFMNCVEILYELAGPGEPAAGYLILPQDDAPLSGMPLEGLIASLPLVLKKASPERTGEAVQTVVDYVNRHWSCDGAVCYGIRLDSNRMETMAAQLNAKAAAYLNAIRLVPDSRLPYMEIMQCVRNSLMPGLIVTAGLPAPAPILRLNLAEDLRRKRIPGEIYGALRFSRLSEWKKMITSRTMAGKPDSSTQNFSTALLPDIVPIPHEILIENLLERFPGWERSQAEWKLEEIGWEKVPATGYSLESRLGRRRC